MKYGAAVNQRDDALIASRLNGFVSAEVYDIHAHPYHPDHFPPQTWKFLEKAGPLGCAEHRAALQRCMPAKTIHGAYFGLPHKSADRPTLNTWVSAQALHHGTSLSRTLMLVSPNDDREMVAAALRRGPFCGLKVYHCYANRPDTMQADVGEFAPEWMWEILHEVRGVLILHIVRDCAMDDSANQQTLRRLCGAGLKIRPVRTAWRGRCRTQAVAHQPRLTTPPPIP